MTELGNDWNFQDYEDLCTKVNEQIDPKKHGKHPYDKCMQEINWDAIEIKGQSGDPVKERFLEIIAHTQKKRTLEEVIKGSVQTKRRLAATELFISAGVKRPLNPLAAMLKKGIAMADFSSLSDDVRHKLKAKYEKQYAKFDGKVKDKMEQMKIGVVRKPHKRKPKPPQSTVPIAKNANRKPKVEKKTNSIVKVEKTVAVDDVGKSQSGSKKNNHRPSAKLLYAQKKAKKMLPAKQSVDPFVTLDSLLDYYIRKYDKLSPTKKKKYQNKFNKLKS